MTDRGWSGGLLNTLFDPLVYAGIHFGASLVAIAGVLWLGFFQGELKYYLFFLSFFILYQILTLVRSRYGLDGSDQMRMIVSVCLMGFVIFFDKENVRILFVGFVVLQLMISYWSAGIAKLVSKEWQSGIAIKGIVSTDIYGSKFLYAAVNKNMILRKAVSWGTILFEIGFPILIFVSKPTFLLAILLGVGFHLLIAVFMGLNNFFWSFVSAYPFALLFHKFIFNS